MTAPACIGEAFDAAAARLSDRTACIERVLGLWRATGWREHAAAVHGLSARLAGAGIGPGSTVGIAGPNGSHRLAAERAVLHRGATVLPLPDPGLPESAEALRRARADAVLAPAEEALAQLGSLMPAAPGFLWHDHQADAVPAPENPAADTPAYAGTAWTHGRLASLSAECPVPPGSNGTMFSFLAPEWHEGHWLVAVAPIAWGTAVAFSENAETVGADLRQLQPEIVAGPPRFWKRLVRELDTASAEANGFQLRMIKLAMSGFLPGFGPWIRGRIHRRLGLGSVRTAAVTNGELAESLQRRFGSLGIEVGGPATLGLPAGSPVRGAAALAEIVALPEVFDARHALRGGENIDVVLDANAVTSAGGAEQPSRAVLSAARSILDGADLAHVRVEIRESALGYLHPAVNWDGTARWHMLDKDA